MTLFLPALFQGLGLKNATFLLLLRPWDAILAPEGSPRPFWRATQKINDFWNAFSSNFGAKRPPKGCPEKNNLFQKPTFLDLNFLKSP